MTGVGSSTGTLHCACETRETLHFDTEGRYTRPVLTSVLPVQFQKRLVRWNTLTDTDVPSHCPFLSPLAVLEYVV